MCQILEQRLAIAVQQPPLRRQVKAAAQVVIDAAQSRHKMARQRDMKPLGAFDQKTGIPRGFIRVDVDMAGLANYLFPAIVLHTKSAIPQEMDHYIVRPACGQLERALRSARGMPPPGQHGLRKDAYGGRRAEGFGVVGAEFQSAEGGNGFLKGRNTGAAVQIRGHDREYRHCCNSGG